MCCRKCLVTAFVSAHVGVCSIVGSDMCLQVVSSGETLAASFMGTLLNKKSPPVIQFATFLYPTIKSRLLKDNQLSSQHAEKVVYDSLGLVDFAIGLVIFRNLPEGKCCLLGKFKLQKDCNQSC